MGFTIYRSTDTSAPTLSGTAGDLVNLLDKCLVAGYGSQVAAGWSKPYTGTNKAVFRQGTGSNQLYLRVQDDGPGAGGAKEARMTGYEAMTTVDAGTNPFPLASQGVGSIAMLVCRKSTSADATTRSWVLVADARTFYLFVLTGDSANVYFTFAFGEFYSLLPSDGYRCMIIGRIAENSGTGANDRFDQLASALSGAVTGHYMPRGHNLTGGPVNFGKHTDYIKSGQAATMGLAVSTIIPYVNPADGGIYLSQIWIHDPTSTPVGGLRGRMRGLWCWCHGLTNIVDGDTLTGVGDLAGKSFLILKLTAGAGCFVIETSDTLESN